MALGNTPRRETNIAVEANKSFAFGVWFKAADGTPIDLTGSTLRFVAAEQGQRGGREVLSVNAVSDVNNPNMLYFQFQADDLALTAGSYSYDVTLIPPSGYSTPVLKGQLEIGSNTDQDTSNIYGSGVNTGTDLIVLLEDRDVVEVTIERVDGLFMLITEVIKDFRDDLAAAQTAMDAQVAAAAASAQIASSKAAQLEDWFKSVGFPFWKGTQAQYDAIPSKDPNVLYLIIA